MRLDSGVLLQAGIAVPVLYFGTLLVGSFFYPGYSQVTQYASELGSATAPHPAIFNAGIISTGVAALLASAGFVRALAALAAPRALALLAGLALALFGVSLLLGGFFPMPDPRHGGFGLGLAIHPAPFFLAAALWRRPSLRSLNVFLLANGVGMLAMFAIMMGVGALVTRGNVGIYQRVNALTVFIWIGVAAGALLRHVPAGTATPHSNAT